MVVRAGAGSEFFATPEILQLGFSFIAQGYCWARAALRRRDGGTLGATAVIALIILAGRNQ
jgi:hypothetical protein